MYTPVFPLGKQDSTSLKTKFRFIFNASAKRPLTQFQHSLLETIESLPENHPSIPSLQEIVDIRSLNDNIIQKDCDLVSVKQIVKSFLDLKWIWKADLAKGFRAIQRPESQ